MIISRGRRYLFVHIPKTGGTALAAALEARAMKDDILIGDTPKAVSRRGRVAPLREHAAGRLWKHSTLADIAGLVGEEELDGMLICAIARNPWDRMVSFYHWLRVQGFDHPAVTLAKAGDFSAFLADPAWQAQLRAAPYGSYLRREGREWPALWLRQERLAEDAAALGERLGIRLGPLSRENASLRTRDWRPYYREGEAEIVARIAAEDIARFGYRFDP